MMKLKHWLGGILILIIIGIVVVNSIKQEKLNENKKGNFEKEFKEFKETEDINKETEEKNIEPINIGIRLAPTQYERGTSSQGGELRSHYVYSETMDIAAKRKWDKSTELKYCIRYKLSTDSSSNRGAVLYANSPLENKYIFQINILEHKNKTDYHCGSWANSKGVIAKSGSGGTYSIDIPFKESFSNKNIFHEVCVDDINSQLNHCASKWGISEDDAYLTNIYRVSASSPANSLDDYVIFDYFKIFVDGDQVSESLFPNQDFDKFSGSINDDKADDFKGWKEYENAYAVDVQE